MGHREMADVIAQKRARDLGGLSNPVCRTNQLKEDIIYKSHISAWSISCLPLICKLRKQASGKFRAKDAGDTKS